MDIVERLRRDAEKARQTWPDVFCVSEDLAERAADEIERLRKILNEQSDAHVEHVRGLNEQNTIREDVYKKQIERLREALREIVASDWKNGVCADIARAALGEEK